MSNIKAGFSRLCITPPLGTALSGYYEARYAKGVLDDLYATAVAFDDGKNRALVIALDLIDTDSKICDEYRRLISEYCGIPAEAVFINCSHTHTGPVVGIDKDSNTVGNPVYDEFLKLQIRDVAKYALEDLCPARLYVAESEAKHISFIRRFRMKNGTVRTNPGINNPDIDHALGEPNEAVKLVKIVREDAEDIFLVNFGVHADTIGGEYISADFPGFVCSTIEDAIYDTKCIFLQGAEGDVNHVNVNPDKYTRNDNKRDADITSSRDHAMHMGRVIAGAVLQICGVAKEVEVDKIEFANKKIMLPSNQDNSMLEESKRIIELHESGRDDELPYSKYDMTLTTAVAEANRVVELENGPESYSFTLSAIRIGDVAFAGIPGEPFTEIGTRICEKSPFETTILCGLTNGGKTYFPTSSAYDEGGYETRSSLIKKGADDIIVNGTVDLLNQIKNA